MASRRKDHKVPKERPPATTIEGRENQLISLAIDVAEEQLRDGTASSQLISHFLKLGSTREVLEQERLANENELLRARVEQLSSARKVEELYQDALNAMKAYSGQDPDDDEDWEYD